MAHRAVSWQGAHRVIVRERRSTGDHSAVGLLLFANPAVRCRIHGSVCQRVWFSPGPSGRCGCGGGAGQETRRNNKPARAAATVFSESDEQTAGGEETMMTNHSPISLGIGRCKLCAWVCETFTYRRRNLVKQQQCLVRHERKGERRAPWGGALVRPSPANTHHPE